MVHGTGRALTQGRIQPTIGSLDNLGIIPLLAMPQSSHLYRINGNQRGAFLVDTTQPLSQQDQRLVTELTSILGLRFQL